MEALDQRRGPVEAGVSPAAVQAYVDALARDGSCAYVANLHTRMSLIRPVAASRAVSINDAEYGQAWVASPHTAYALSARAELDHVDVGWSRPLLAGAATALGALLRAARANQVVHLDNLLLSTNPHPPLEPGEAQAFRRLGAERWPGHLLAVRSLDAVSSGERLAAYRADGWRLIAARQVWLIEDPRRQWLPRRDARRDLRLLEAGPDAIDDLRTLRPGDAGRIADLYGGLYLGKYGAFSPAYTPAFVELTHRLGLIRYRGLRAPDGRLSGFVGMAGAGGWLSTPLLGYDLTRPQADGLYRRAMALSALSAMDAGLGLHWSAGAAGFKRARGARPTLEYTAYEDRRLSPPRRLAMDLLQAAMNRIAAPLAARNGW